MQITDLVVRTAARHGCGKLLPHLKVRHRLVIAAVLAGGGLLAWYVTEREVYYKVFEFSSAPFVDLVLFKLGIIPEIE